MNGLRQIFETTKPLDDSGFLTKIAALIGAPKPISLKYLLEKASMDSDLDRIPDFLEQILAERYAPIIYHSSDESNFPTNVDWFLQKTELRFYDDKCTPDLDELVIKCPTQELLLKNAYHGGCGSNDIIYSNGTRSQNKQRTFYLKDVAEEFRKGSMDSRDWTTYYHAYPNDAGGVTIQYWRFYAYNDAANNHGGDWEGFHLILDKNLKPSKLGLLGHKDISYLNPSDLQWENTHVRIFSEGGGHGSRADPNPHLDLNQIPPVQPGIKAKGGDGIVDPNNPVTFIRQETWTDGNVQWFNGATSKSGALVNLGSKIRPMNGQMFIQYSGLWGSPGTFYFTSGYWGPAFNETGMKDDWFITAWGAGMAGEADMLRRECYPTAQSR